MSGAWLKPLAAVVLVALATSGCALVLGGAAGALIVDEGMVEDDGRFDPLENTEVGRSIYD